MVSGFLDFFFSYIPKKDVFGIDWFLLFWQPKTSRVCFVSYSLYTLINITTSLWKFTLTNDFARYRHGLAPLCHIMYF